MSLVARLKKAIELGPPGWAWAGALTTSVMVQEFRGELSTQFATYAGGLVTAWLGYRWVRRINGKKSGHV